MMDIKYFKCTLDTDIVINASLATEGNMRTLDYIPGSKFSGIVAGQLYRDWKLAKRQNVLMDVFHSTKVSFGDAHISIDKKNKSYALPFSLFKDKLAKEITEGATKIWVHHYLHKNNLPKKEKQEEEKKEEVNKKKSADKIQLKQLRSGYFDKSLNFLPKVNKKFALKSAQDRQKRRSKDEAMFGFESMQKGQVFIFSVYFSKELDVTIKEDVIKALLGKKRVGKSKSAQYGQVTIEPIEKELPEGFENNRSPILSKPEDNKIAIYAESNLCFLNEYGQATFQPTAADFGIKGSIDWSLSQVRTYSYSPWNNHRNTTDTQRDCILKGSVFIVKVADNFASTSIDKLPKMVGEYQAEGLGRILFNPSFLKGNQSDALWSIRLKKYPPEVKEDNTENQKASPFQDSNPLGEYLLRQQQKAKDELKIGKAVLTFMNGRDKDTKLTYESIFENISTSQWGSIRAKAIYVQNQKKPTLALIPVLEEMLSNGVAAERYWDKRKGLPREILLGTLRNYEEEENKLSLTQFIAVLAAEMTELKQKKDKKKTSKSITS